MKRGVVVALIVGLMVAVVIVVNWPSQTPGGQVTYKTPKPVPYEAPV